MQNEVIGEPEADAPPVDNNSGVAGSQQDAGASSGHADGHHPSDWDYVKVALWLAFFTLIEVGTYFESVHNMPRWSLYVILTVLMIIKFFMVGAYFMHLKHDTPWFRRIFLVGVVAAVLLYFAVFLSYNYFGWV